MKSGRKICLCLIATRRYDVFIQPLLESINKYFLLDHIVEIHLFTDKYAIYGQELHKMIMGRRKYPVYVIPHKIESYGYPDATLLRYEIIRSVQFDCHYLYYMDVDMLITGEVGEEFLGEVVAVLHPGFSEVGGGSWCSDPKSLAFTPEEKRLKYFAGGVQGGEYAYFHTRITEMSARIQKDRSNGVKAEHNDESHWNAILAQYSPTVILNSSYCMVEQYQLRKLWKIDHLQPKIIALEKTHEYFQQP